MSDDLVLNIAVPRPRQTNRPRNEQSEKSKPFHDTADNDEKKRAKAPSKHGHKSSSLFTKLPDLVLPTNMPADKTDYTITNAPTADSFSSMNLDDFLLHSLQSQQMQNPTDIQRIVIPQLLQKPLTDRDIIIQAQTGSGKTLAYCLPILHDLISTGYHDRAVGTLALIVVPTRELCQQVYDTFYSLIYPKSSKVEEEVEDEDDEEGESTEKPQKEHKLGPKKSCKYRWIVPSIICGGQSKKSEKARLRKGVTILVATPGRLLDHLRSTKCVNFKLLKWLVMDEADRFEEMGMRESMVELQSELQRLGNGSHKTVLCSATVDEKVLQLGGTDLNNAMYLSSKVLNDDEQKMEVVPNQVRTTFLTVPAKLRLVTLAGLLKIIEDKNEGSKTIVFFSNCATVEYYYKLISSKFPNVTKLHGAIAHDKRVETLKNFKSGILLTTDLAARGLDFPGVKDIIQYDIPNDAMACMHRIGRTARCGSAGNAYIFVMPHEVGWIEHMKDLVEGTVQSYQPILDELQISMKGKDVRVELAGWQKQFEEMALKDMKHAKEAFVASVKAYATHPKDVRAVLGVKSLHLGHYAKSYALREAPSNLLSKTAKKRARQRDQNNRQPKKFKMDIANEFAA